MVGQDVGIGLVEVPPFDPVRRADWVERHCYLVVQIRIQLVQITTKTVVQNVNVFGKKEVLSLLRTISRPVSRS